MTWAEFDRDLQSRIDAYKEQKQNILIEVGKTIEAIWKARIFNLGRDASGNIIGVYSKTATWATIEQFDKESAFNSRVKNRKRAVNKGSNPGPAGSPRESIDLPGGYAELREIQGKKSDFVNLDYTGSLRVSFQLGTRGDEVIYGTPNQTSLNKKRWLERHFNTEIWALSEDEVEIGTEATARAINLILFT